MVSNTKKWGISTCLTGLLLCTATSLYALGLGNMDLESRLNQPFSANIPVLVPEDIQASEITVKLAADSQFERVGLKRSSTVYMLEFFPERRADGQMVIGISTKDRVIEPMLSFVLEVEQGGNRTLRKYTAMLEAPTR